MAWMPLTPIGLAPFYGYGMYERASRAGLLPTPAGWEQFTYAGRLQDVTYGRYGLTYDLAAAERTMGLYGYISPYRMGQIEAERARTAYWQFQQQWTGPALTWGGVKLASYAFPQAAIIRALGFPFYGAEQRLGAAAAMAPYVQAAWETGPMAQQRILTSTAFWPYQFPTWGEIGVSSLGEWTFGQMGFWGIQALMRGGMRGLGRTMQWMGPISLMQPGLEMVMSNLATLAARETVGIPISAAEYTQAYQQMALGGGMIGAGVLAQWQMPRITSWVMSRLGGRFAGVGLTADVIPLGVSSAFPSYNFGGRYLTELTGGRYISYEQLIPPRQVPTAFAPTARPWYARAARFAGAFVGWEVGFRGGTWLEQQIAVAAGAQPEQVTGFMGPAYGAVGAYVGVAAAPWAARGLEWGIERLAPSLVGRGAGAAAQLAPIAAVAGPIAYTFLGLEMLGAGLQVAQPFYAEYLRQFAGAPTTSTQAYVAAGGIIGPAGFPWPQAYGGLGPLVSPQERAWTLQRQAERAGAVDPLAPLMYGRGLTQLSYLERWQQQQWERQQYLRGPVYGAIPTGAEWAALQQYAQRWAVTTGAIYGGLPQLTYMERQFGYAGYGYQPPELVQQYEFWKRYNQWMMRRQAGRQWREEFYAERRRARGLYGQAWEQFGVDVSAAWRAWRMMPRFREGGWIPRPTYEEMRAYTQAQLPPRRFEEWYTEQYYAYGTYGQMREALGLGYDPWQGIVPSGFRGNVPAWLPYSLTPEESATAIGEYVDLPPEPVRTRTEEGYLITEYWNPVTKTWTEGPPQTETREEYESRVFGGRGSRGEGRGGGAGVGGNVRTGYRRPRGTWTQVKETWVPRYRLWQVLSGYPGYAYLPSRAEALESVIPDIFPEGREGLEKWAFSYSSFLEFMRNMPSEQLAQLVKIIGVEISRWIYTESLGS